MRTLRWARIAALGLASSSCGLLFAQDVADVPNVPYMSQQHGVRRAANYDADQVAALDSFVQPATPPATTPSAPTLPETNVVGETTPGNQMQPTPFFPQGSGVPSVLQGTIFDSAPVRGYNADTSTVGTYLDTPNIQFPGTINTITRDVINDQAVLHMDDIIRDIPGAVKSFGGDGVIRPDQFFVRGFQVTSKNWRRDNYLDPSYVPRDPANIERIDVLKGPSSVLYGAAQPTGTFNLVTKKPMAESFAVGSMMFGTWDLQRYTVDANSAVNEDGTVLVRVNAAYQNSDSFRTSVFNEREFVSPVVTWILDDKTSLTWAGEYQHDRFRMDQGIPAINGDVFAVNRRTFTGDPNGDLANYHSYRSTLTLVHEIDDVWTSRIGGSSLFYTTPSTTTFLSNASLGPDGFINSPIIGRDQTIAQPFSEQNHDIIETLAGEFDTGNISHHLVLGMEQDWFITNHDTFTQSIGSAYGAIDVTSGNQFPVSPPADPFFLQNVFDNPSFFQNQFGWFAQDIMDLTDRLHLLLGGRIDYLRQDYARSSTLLSGGFPVPGQSTGLIETSDTFTQFSPRVGMTYDLVPNTMSVYWGYSRSFTPSVGAINFTPVALIPETGDIWEGGIKTYLLDDLYVTAGGFYIKENNVNVEIFNPSPGPNQPAFTATQVGTIRSQGAEVSVTGEITNRLTTTSNFAYVDTAQDSVDPFINGKSVRGVPNWTGNVWVRYNFIQERQQTLGAALGMIYVGDRVGDYFSPLVLPQYDIWDLGFYYTQGRLTTQLVWNNIFDSDYAVSSISQYQVMPGAPSNVRFQVGYTF